MLANIHTTLQQLLFQHAALPAIVDIRCEMPTKQWVGSLTRPTINFYLYDLQENTELRQTNPHANRANGHTTHRMPPRRFDLRYMVSVLAGDAEDEQMLLWHVLATLIKHQTFPADTLPEALKALDPPLVTKVGKPDDSPRTLDLWSTFDLPPRPALLYTITAPLDLDVVFKETKLVLKAITHMTRPTMNDEAAGNGIDPTRVTRRRLTNRAPEDGVALAETQQLTAHITGVIRDVWGSPLAEVRMSVEGHDTASITDHKGKFTLARVPVGPATLRIERGDEAPRQRAIVVPSETYDIVLE
jgi:hypothetical protein